MRSFVREESSHGVRIYWLEQSRVIEEIQKKAVRTGAADQNVLKIVLFGSLAVGRGVPGSDADVLVLLAEDRRRFPDRIPEWLEKLYIDFPMDVFPYTVNEEDTPMLKEALARGIVLYEKQDS